MARRRFIYGSIRQHGAVAGASVQGEREGNGWRSLLERESAPAAGEEISAMDLEAQWAISRNARPTD